MATKYFELSGKITSSGAKLQGFDEAFAQLRQIGQRSAQKGDLTRDPATAGESADRLIDDCLEDGRRQILNRRTLR